MNRFQTPTLFSSSPALLGQKTSEHELPLRMRVSSSDCGGHGSFQVPTGSGQISARLLHRHPKTCTLLQLLASHQPLQWEGLSAPEGWDLCFSAVEPPRVPRGRKVHFCVFFDAGPE